VLEALVEEVLVEMLIEALLLQLEQLIQAEVGVVIHLEMVQLEDQA
jgi:hypothetical protein